MKKGTKQGKKPFFARLLEAQELEHVVGGGTVCAEKSNSNANRPVVYLSVGDNTLKYPSDGDELA